jgi:Uma2 family endonuclease
MSTITRPVTAEDLFNMPGDQRRELVKGEVRTMAPAGAGHGAIINTLAYLLTDYVRAKKLGVIFGAETGFRLAENPDTVRGADIAFVAAARVPAGGLPKGFWPGAPDLAVEVLSPTDTVEEIEEKVDEYLSAGAKLLWVVNPKRQTITVYRPGHNPVILRQHQELDGEDIIPGFKCRVADVFA